jgi:hypothetical protein
MIQAGRAATLGAAAQLACAAGLLACAAALGWAAGAETRLYVNGKVASTDVIMRDGRAYVPVKDVAAALGLVVVNKSDGFALTAAGGAGQVRGLNGKVGDDMFNGSFRFKVVRVVRGDSYKRQFSTGSDIPAPAGEEIVAIVIRLKNGTSKTQYPMVAGTGVTALTDEDQHSVAPYDTGYLDSPGRNVTMLPGAAIDFALAFHMQKNAKLKDLVYQVDSGNVTPNPPFRVSVGE